MYFGVPFGELDDEGNENHRNMFNKKKPIKAVILLIAGMSLSGICLSQAAYTSGGGSISAAAGSVSYSIGQTVSADATGSTGLAGAGFQQPYEKVIINGLNDDLSIDLVITTYPNPVNDILKLRSTGSVAGDMSYRVINSRGDVLIDNIIDSDEMDIQMKNYSPGVYFINVYRNNVNVRSIKIIKK